MNSTFILGTSMLTTTPECCQTIRTNPLDVETFYYTTDIYLENTGIEIRYWFYPSFLSHEAKSAGGLYRALETQRMET